MIMKELALIFFIVSSILVLIRSWMTFNLDRIVMNIAPKSFIGYFFHDIGNNYDIMIEPICKKLENQKADNYRIKVNLITYFIYFGFALAIIFYLI